MSSNFANLNYFEACQELYFGGTTGGGLGPEIQSSWLDETKAQRWEVGFQPSAARRGVDMGATPIVPNTAFFDFNSLDNGTNDYDTRLLSIGGEAGTDGRGTLVLAGNRFTFSGNTINPSPLVQVPNGINYIGGSPFYHPPTNQGRLHSVREVVWSGTLAPSNPNPSIIVSLFDIDTSVPFTGYYNITMSNGYSGTGQSLAFFTLAITKDIAGANPWNWEEVSKKGDNLTALYVTPGLTNPSYPSINLYNKTADPAKYIITGYVFYDTEM